MIGFGDPVFNPALEADGVGAPSAQQGRRAQPCTTRLYRFLAGRRRRPREACAGAAATADTADELKAVAKNLGAPPSDIHLGSDASETTVKQAALADYRIVYFATHGLVAGDIKGLAEPSLALTFPTSRRSSMTACSPRAKSLSSSSMPTGWCSRPATRSPATSPAPRPCRGWRARSSMPARGRCWSRIGRSIRTPPPGSPPRPSTSSRPTELGRAEALRRAMLAYLDDLGPAKRLSGLLGAVRPGRRRRGTLSMMQRNN